MNHTSGARTESDASDPTKMTVITAADSVWPTFIAAPRICPSWPSPSLRGRGHSTQIPRAGRGSGR